ncbi:MAG: hypothetical protein A2046_14710 [Bacteroidetes bacterium GWA2_30_7]|nr:MAG: hypothetical protein A2046_14710 [Bacteroidetes bacterium GWA2_30_7]
MKLKIIFYLLFIIATNSFSQTKKSFEGIIKYNIQYQSKDSTKVDEYLGNEAIIYIKHGYYRQEYPNSKYITSVIYRQDDNKYYYFFKNTDTVLIQDCSFILDTLINISKNNKTTKILNSDCKSIVLQHQKETLTYFYDEDIFINPIFFVNHKYASYDRYAQETKSIYLKIIITDAKSDFIMTAYDINKIKINKRIYKVKKQSVHKST